MENKTLRLTKKVAECSDLSRREAAMAIKKGEITINGVVEKNPAAEIQPDDVIARNGLPLVKKEKEEYFLFNKPKGMLFNQKSNKNRPSVLEIMAKYSKARLQSVQPIPDTACGLLLLCNDEDLVRSFQTKEKSIRQKYEVIVKGLSDPEELTGLETHWKAQSNVFHVQRTIDPESLETRLEIEMHGNDTEPILDSLKQKQFPVVKTDRVSIGGMTKKDISRGWYRSLTEKEIIWLKHFT